MPATETMALTCEWLRIMKQDPSICFQNVILFILLNHNKKLLSAFENEKHMQYENYINKLKS